MIFAVSLIFRLPLLVRSLWILVPAPWHHLWCADGGHGLRRIPVSAWTVCRYLHADRDDCAHWSVGQNSILIVEYAKMRVDNGRAILPALIDTVKVRLRPILMTAFSTVVVLCPLRGPPALGPGPVSPLVRPSSGGWWVPRSFPSSSYRSSSLSLKWSSIRISLWVLSMTGE